MYAHRLYDSYHSKGIWRLPTKNAIGHEVKRRANQGGSSSSNGALAPVIGCIPFCRDLQEPDILVTESVHVEVHGSIHRGEKTGTGTFDAADLLV